MTFLIKYQLQKTNINYTEFKTDENYNVEEDKIINIQFNQIEFKKISNLFKTKLLNDDLNINSFIKHIDRDEFYYVKDLFIDLNYPLTTSEKKTKLFEIYKYIIENLINIKLNKNQVLLNTTKEIKKNIDYFLIPTTNSDDKKLLYIFTKYPKNKSITNKNIEPKLEIIENFLKTTLKEDFENKINIQIKNIFNCTNEIDFGGSLIFKIVELNSKKIEYTLTYLTEIYEKVFILKSVHFNIIKEDFYLVCVNKQKESYLNGIPIIPFDYMPVNYSNMINIIYFTKILRKKLLNLYMLMDHYIFINGKEKHNYNKFEYYYKKMLNIDIYKQYIDWLK